MRTYIIKAGEGNQFLSVELGENGQSFDVHWRTKRCKLITIRVDKDEKRILSAVITSDGRRLVATVECETSESLQQELLLSDLPLTFFQEAEEEKVELTQEEVQEAVQKAHVAHKALCDQYGGGPMMCFTQTKHDAMEEAKREKSRARGKK